MDSAHDTTSLWWVAPFGDPGINGCSRLRPAYRSVPRPSSPLDAKASTRCPFFTRPLQHQTHPPGKRRTRSVPKPSSIPSVVAPRAKPTARRPMTTIAGRRPRHVENPLHDVERPPSKPLGPARNPLLPANGRPQRSAALPVTCTRSGRTPSSGAPTNPAGPSQLTAATPRRAGPATEHGGPGPT